MKMRKAVASGLAALLAAAVLAACGDAPDDADPGTAATTAAAAERLPALHRLRRRRLRRQVVQPARLRGRQQAADELGVELKAVESNSENDYAPNIESLVAEGCDAIVTVGFALAAATKESAAANPDIEYVLIDDAADGGDDGATFDGKADEPNIKPLLYDTAQAAFMAGYLPPTTARPASSAPTAAMPFPTVTIFMDGFKQGAEYYAKEKGKDVKVVGWDGDNGLLHRWLRGQRDGDQHRPAAARPGRRRDPAGRRPDLPGRADRDRRLRQGVAMIGVDADVFETDPNTQDVDPHLDPEEHEGLDLRGDHGRGRRQVRLRLPTSAPWRTTASASRRSTTSRTRSSHTWPTSWRGEGRHHRRLDPGDVVPFGFLSSKV